MIACELPFGPDTSSNLLSNIRECKYSFDSPLWQKTSPDIRDLISRLLVADPTARYDTTQIMMHRWIRKHKPVLESMYEKVFAY